MLMRPKHRSKIEEGKGLQDKVSIQKIVRPAWRLSHKTRATNRRHNSTNTGEMTSYFYVGDKLFKWLPWDAQFCELQYLEL